MTDKVSYVCDECGSNNVSLDALGVYWDEADQQFTVEDICDKGHFCNDCDDYCRVERVPWKPPCHQHDWHTNGLGVTYCWNCQAVKSPS